MKLFKMLVSVGLVLLFSGCASTNGPTSQVGIVNGKYAVQTTVPNNNKGKKVNLTAGQIHSCEISATDMDGQQKKYTFDLKIAQDGKHISWYNVKTNGVTPENYYISKMIWKQGLGFVETTKQDKVLLPSQDNNGKIVVFESVKDAKNFHKVLNRFANGEITKSEWENQMKKYKVRLLEAVCTQMTDNTYTHTRYLTAHEIDAYKHGQQIAVQQRAIDSADHNERRNRINYNTQQMLNRTNTYNVKVY